MTNEQSQNGRGEYQINEITYANGGGGGGVNVKGWELPTLNFET